MTRYILAAILITTAATGIGLQSIHADSGSCYAAPGGTPITGYAWSDNIGWIDLNCSNSGTCGTNNFGLTVAANGTVSGCAWSDNIGWISASSADIVGCPSGACISSISATTGSWSGWLKALSASDAQSGGWSGWISLSGTSPNYSVTVGSNGHLSGYGWDDTYGWIDFSRATTAFSCTPTYTCNGTIIQNSCDATKNVTCVSPTFCSTGSPVCVYPQPQPQATSGHSGHLEAKPSLIPKSATTKVYWNIINVQSCSVSGSNGDHWSGLSSAGMQSTAITSNTIYTLSCVEYDNTNYTESVTVNLLPVYQEK